MFKKSDYQKNSGNLYIIFSYIENMIITYQESEVKDDTNNRKSTQG